MPSLKDVKLISPFEHKDDVTIRGSAISSVPSQLDIGCLRSFFDCSVCSLHPTVHEFTIPQSICPKPTLAPMTDMGEWNSQNKEGMAQW